MTADEDATSSARSTVRRVAPGVAFLAVLAGVARAAAGVVPVASELVVAVALGLVVANTVGVPESLAAGVETHTRWLELGIVLMGARVSLSTLLSTGPTLAVLVVGVVLLTLVLVEALANGVFGVRGKLGSLLAAGASVCGVSAAVGVAGSIGANEDDLAYAAGTILLFDVVTLFAYPVVGSALGLTERVFGVWAGLTMFSTGPVTAAGFAFGDVAGRWATVTKLTRNLLLGVLVVGYSLWYANADTAGSERDDDTETGRDDATTSSSSSFAGSLRAIASSFPTFVLGFFAVVVLTSSAVVPDAATASMERAYQGLFLVAFAGLGLSVDVDDLRSTGGAPIALVLTALLATSAVALVAVQTLLGP
ncbi:YeiH family protein [Halorubellus litoreus]|uniref:YeiH family protein n=1 Tax=Halorubellus litoreus TaxID=755308 RepID=A0ABD5VNA4_9EURY